MNEEVKKQILDVFKGFLKGVLKDSILIVLFFTAIGYFIRQSELCDVQVLVRNASEQAMEIKTDCDQYVDDLLNDAEARLEMLLNKIRQDRMELNSGK